jgi:hypothetical protein
MSDEPPRWPADGAAAAAARRGLYTVTAGFLFTFAGYGAIENLLSTFHSSCVHVTRRRDLTCCAPTTLTLLALLTTQAGVLLERYGLLRHRTRCLPLPCHRVQARDATDDGRGRPHLHCGEIRHQSLGFLGCCLLPAACCLRAAVDQQPLTMPAGRLLGTCSMRYRSLAWSSASFRPAS